MDGLVEPVNPGGVGTYAFVIYGNGKKIKEEKGVIGEGLSNNQSEYIACIKALERLISLGLTNEPITINSDSKLLINQLRGIYKVKSPRLLKHYQKLKTLLSSFSDVRFRWVPREENKEADDLTNKAYLEYIESHPQFYNKFKKYLATGRQKELLRKLKLEFSAGISKRKASELIKRKIWRKKLEL